MKTIGFTKGLCLCMLKHRRWNAYFLLFWYLHVFVSSIHYGYYGIWKKMAKYLGNIVRCVLLNNCLSWNMMKPSSTPKANLGDITSTSWEWTPFQLIFQTVALLAQVGLEGQCLYNYPDRQSWGALLMTYMLTFVGFLEAGQVVWFLLLRALNGALFCLW